MSATTVTNFPEYWSRTCPLLRIVIRGLSRCDKYKYPLVGALMSATTVTYYPEYWTRTCPLRQMLFHSFPMRMGTPPAPALPNFPVTVELCRVQQFLSKRFTFIHQLLKRAG